jgi:hypothetical protein
MFQAKKVAKKQLVSGLIFLHQFKLYSTNCEDSGGLKDPNGLTESVITDGSSQCKSPFKKVNIFQRKHLLMIDNSESFKTTWWMESF